MSFPLLSLMVFLPWIGAALLALSPGVSARVARSLSLLFSLSTAGLAAVAWSKFDPAAAGYQWVELHAWIGSLNVHYHLGLDGMSLLLVVLTAIVSPAALLASWRGDHNPRHFGACFLLLQGSALGVFLALDFFHWFVFWELSLVPAYFLIKLWGGPAATRAAYQFVIYTIGGSAFMLLGFAAIFATTGTLDFTQLSQLASEGLLSAKLGALGSWGPRAAFFGILLGLAVKVPLFPFHTWQPPAYAEAPTGARAHLARARRGGVRRLLGHETDRSEAPDRLLISESRELLPAGHLRRCGRHGAVGIERSRRGFGAQWHAPANV